MDSSCLKTPQTLVTRSQSQRDQKVIYAINRTDQAKPAHFGEIRSASNFNLEWNPNEMLRKQEILVDQQFLFWFAYPLSIIFSRIQLSRLSPSRLLQGSLTRPACPTCANQMTGSDILTPFSCANCGLTASITHPHALGLTTTTHGGLHGDIRESFAAAQVISVDPKVLQNDSTSNDFTCDKPDCNTIDCYGFSWNLPVFQLCASAFREGF